LGEEWSDATSFQDVVKEMIIPYCKDANVIEIGVGGGRVALTTIEHVQNLIAIDISSQMLKHA